MSELDNPVVVEFPLRGEWIAVHTPAQSIPSHGTNWLGQRFAYDFLRTDHRSGIHIFPGSMVAYYSIGVPAGSCYCSQEPIHSPFDAEVVAARDGLRQRNRLQPFMDVFFVLKNTFVASARVKIFGPRSLNLQLYVGNHVILKRENTFALLAHLYPNSILVRPGQVVRAGDVLGSVGHTGNSTAPHLHFQLMDADDLLAARGVPCAFRRLEVFQEGEWKTVEDVFPKRNQRFRSVV